MDNQKKDRVVNAILTISFSLTLLLLYLDDGSLQPISIKTICEFVICGIFLMTIISLFLLALIGVANTLKSIFIYFKRILL